MPATFESFGVKFLYPENWKVLDRETHEQSEGMTMELPSGGFFSIERVDPASSAESLIDSVGDTLQAEYEELEREALPPGDSNPGEAATDFRFYYLDLVIVSRVIVLPTRAGTLLLQFQAESRDFDANERVIDAIVMQLREKA